MLSGIKGAIFDLDGTMIDSMGIWEKVDHEFLKKRNIKMPHDLSETIKYMTFEDTAQYFKERFGLTESVDEIIKEWDDMVYSEYSSSIPLKGGAREYLGYLKNKGLKIGLATSSSMRLLEATLKNHCIFHYFDAVVTVDQVKRDKSFPDIFLLIAAKLGLKPKECMVFEDILAAVLSAKKAGMKAIGVYDRYSEYQWESIKKHADFYIHDFTQLIQQDNMDTENVKN